MTAIAPPIAEEELHAYADGGLDPARRAAVEAWLETHLDDAERVAFYRRLNAELHSRYDPILESPVPAAMTAPRRRFAWRPATAAIVLLALGAGGGWFARDTLPRVESPPAAATSAAPSAALEPLPAQAASAHALYTIEVRHPVEVRAGEAHLFPWLSRRVGRDIKAPSLEASGFRLMGGRVLPVGDGAVASLLMYENAAGLRLTLYMKATRPSEHETAFQFVEREEIGTFYWKDDKLGYALTAKLTREQLSALARVVYEQISG